MNACAASPAVAVVVATSYYSYNRMATAVPASNPTQVKPRSMSRAKRWSEEVEEVYRFQLAGYRDRHDYAAQNGETGVSSSLSKFIYLINFFVEIYVYRNLKKLW